ncbi:hypothetical protein ABZV78_29265, partial [Micromonospora sp. NPDC004540]
MAGTPPSGPAAGSLSTSGPGRCAGARTANASKLGRSRETRARVQREAKRVADLAAAAVMAAAAGGVET